MTVSASRPIAPIRKAAALAALLTALLATLPGTHAPQALSSVVTHVASVDPGITGASGTVGVIVRGHSAAAAALAVQSAGGRVTLALPIVNGVAADVSSTTIARLARMAAVTSISLDRRVTVLENPPPATTTPNSTAPPVIGANAVWAQGYNGAGVTVAVIDTGIANVPGLAGRIVPVVVDDLTGATAPCINFSGEAGCQDSYGHGTFVAGVIAGSGAGSNGQWKGVAPKARVLSVKLSGANGAADVSTLLASIQWVVAHRAQYGIRVLNLSIGSDSPQSYLIDPLNFAVEQAWKAGIVVVVAASNRGPNPATITKPGDDPWVITVGAIDDLGTVDPSDDRIPNFSGRGPTLSDAFAKPDLVAPGAHVVSLRAPGSAIDQNFPTFIDDRYRKASGTSFATPAVAGTVALMLQRDPTLVPNRIKYALTSTARPTASSNPFDVGAGLINAFAASNSAPPGLANQGLLQSNGTGSLDASRGTLRVMTTDPVPFAVTGNLTQMGLVFNQLDYTVLLADQAGATWAGANWHGANWHGANWHGANWHGANWHGANWHGANWHGVEDKSSQSSYGTPYLGSALLGAWE